MVFPWAQIVPAPGQRGSVNDSSLARAPICYYCMLHTLVPGSTAPWRKLGAVTRDAVGSGPPCRRGFGCRKNGSWRATIGGGRDPKPCTGSGDIQFA